jgi:hypothetical protein
LAQVSPNAENTPEPKMPKLSSFDIVAYAAALKGNSASFEKLASWHYGGLPEAKEPFIGYWTYNDIHLLPKPRKKQETTMPLSLRTQKAKGIHETMTWSALPFGPKACPDVQVLPTSPGEVTFPAFCRPCPVTPRHGFVDSQRVSGWEQVHTLLQLAQHEDGPEAEVVVMEELTGEHSAVMTNAGVTWGRSNDGVTADTDKKATFIPAPCSMPKPAVTFQKQIQALICDCFREEDLIKDTPYVELVEHEGRMHYVQLRDGPPQETSADFIPKATNITYIMEPQGDLLEWEHAVKFAKQRHGDGVVICLHGGSMASHYAVHGIQEDIPVVTTRDADQLRDMRLNAVPLSPSENKRTVLTTSKLKAIWRHLYDFNSDPMLFADSVADDESGGFTRVKKRAQLALTAVGALHTQHFWGTEDIFLRLRAFMALALLKFGYAVCAGEMRHYKGGKFRTFPELFTRTECNNRVSVYRRVLVERMDFAEVEGVLSRMIETFEEGSWERGFGGDKWADIARNTLTLCKAIRAFSRSKTQKKWSSVVKASNVVVNTMHNNGKSMTKIIDTGTMTAIANYPAFAFLNNFFAREFLGFKSLK